MMYVLISKKNASTYQIDLGSVVLTMPKSSLFPLGLALYHIAMGNWPYNVKIEVPNLQFDLDDPEVET